MDARLTAEQAALRDAAARLAADLGPGSVHDLASDDHPLICSSTVTVEMQITSVA